jgi:hypothetical protein
VRRSLLALALAAAATSAVHSAPKRRFGVEIGDLAWTDREVLRAEPPDKTKWRRVASGDKLRTGDTVRTGEDAVARVELPWMAVTLGPSTMFTVPQTSGVLSTVLEQGRAEFSGAGRNIVKIQVGDGEVRGGGRLVLRRSVGQTSATVLSGAFHVRVLGRTVEVKAGQGTVIMDGRPPTPASPLPEPPAELRPGADPVYVRLGRPVELRWKGTAPAFHLELLALQGESVLLAREAAAPPLRVEVPWPGTFRWRVSARDARGLESRPSPEGYVCLVER